MKVLAIIILAILIILLILWLLSRRSKAGNYSGKHLNEDFTEAEEKGMKGDGEADYAELLSQMKADSSKFSRAKREPVGTKEPEQESLLYLFQDDPEEKNKLPDDEKEESEESEKAASEESSGDSGEKCAEAAAELDPESAEAPAQAAPEAPAEEADVEAAEELTVEIFEEPTEEPSVALETEPSEKSAAETVETAEVAAEEIVSRAVIEPVEEPAEESPEEAVCSAASEPEEETVGAFSAEVAEELTGETAEEFSAAPAEEAAQEFAEAAEPEAVQLIPEEQQDQNKNQPAARKMPIMKTPEPRPSGLAATGSFSRIIAVNFETPNNEHDSICNIGITIGDQNNRISTNITVNPEEKVEDVPDGMTEEEILSSPTFKELWPELSRLFSGALVIAHNASYDLTILKKVLKAYDLPVPEFSQACTYRMSRKFHPEFDNYKLGSICQVYGIPLDVTNAVSHSDACFDIFCRLVDEGNDVFAEAKQFTL